MPGILLEYMKFILGKKVEMTQIFNEKGDVIPVTVIETGECEVLQIKTKEKDGYTAIQLGSGVKKHYTKPAKQHLKELDANKLKEMQVEDVSEYKRGDKLDISIFEINELVVVTGISKGKGFAGTIKRHNFKSGPSSHGHDHHRQPGSIGAMGRPNVHKGKKMAGRMGGDQISTKNLKVAAIDKKANVIAVKGAVPGANNEWVFIKKLSNE